MTPSYVTLINDAIGRKFHGNFTLTAIIATTGAIAIRYDGIDEGFF
jgi:hypothetical protein